jgi:hypothetical protein
MRKGKLFLIPGLIFLSLAYLSAPLAGEEKVVVVLKSRVQVKGDFIYLEEIIQDIEADERLKQRLIKIKVGASPLPGKMRSLNKDYILVRLYQSGLSPGEVSVQGTERVLVLRESFSDEQTFSEGGENYLIRRGDMVNLVVEEANLRVVTRGRALKSGRKGEIIEVLNISSFKKIKGKIIAPFTVRVSL